MTAFFQSEFFYNYRRSSSAMIGSALMVFFALAVLVGPFVVSQNPYDIAALNLMDSYKPPVWLDGGDPQFWLGTDGQGRDVVHDVLFAFAFDAFWPDGTWMIGG